MHFDSVPHWCTITSFIAALQYQWVGFVMRKQFTEYSTFIFLYLKLKQGEQWTLKHNKFCIVEAHIKLTIDIKHFKRTDNLLN